MVPDEVGEALGLGLVLAVLTVASEDHDAQTVAEAIESARAMDNEDIDPDDEHADAWRLVLDADDDELAAAVEAAEPVD